MKKTILFPLAILVIAFIAPALTKRKGNLSVALYNISTLYLHRTSSLDSFLQC